MAVAMRMPYQRTTSGPIWKATEPGEANMSPYDISIW
jgi:hypothetical protein